MPGRHCHWTILVNERAGAFRQQTGRREVQNLADSLGLSATVRPVPAAGDMRALVRALIEESSQGGGAHIAVMGGDGTVANIVQVLARTEATLGIIPQGTYNNFANALQLPMGLRDALKVLKHGTPTPVSLGRVTSGSQRGHSRYFTEAVGVGIFAEVLARYDEQNQGKNLFRILATLLRVLQTFKARHIRLVLDGEPWQRRTIFCTVANTYRYGMGIPVAPDARLTDEVLDGVLIGDLTPLEMLRYYLAFHRQEHRELPGVSTFKAREIRIEGAHHLNVHCDGWVFGSTPVVITAEPMALKVMLPRQGD